MISLPSKWIQANKLDKGDEIELEEKNNILTVSLNPTAKTKETEITLHSTTESAMRTILTNVYREGYDKVKVNLPNKEALKTVEKLVSMQLLGFEVIKKTEKTCFIENITEPSKDQFENIFSKMILNIEELFDLSKSALEGGKYEGFIQTEEKIKQFDNFCRRIISKESVEREDLQLAFHQELVHAQRNLYYLLLFMSKNKTKAGKPELEMLEECKKMFNMLKETYYTRNMETIEKLHDIQAAIYKKGYALLLKPSTNSVVLYHLLNATRGFYLASSPLIAFAL
jgi:phosphate uptake regulator